VSAKFFTASFSLGTVIWAAIFALGVFFCTSAFGQTSVVMTIGSRHLDGGNYCETNPGFGVEHNWMVGGFYKNSLCRNSVYLGLRYVPLQYGKWRGGLVALGVSGYEDPVTWGLR
jgi:hypothetical protein